LGIYAYEAKDYPNAYKNFNSVLIAHKMLLDNKQESSLADDKTYNDQVYITGLAALNAEMEMDAKGHFEELYNKKIDKPGVYEALYKIYAKEDLDKAYVYLVSGREIFPDDVSLLFAEINHFLKQNKLDELIGKLETAIKKEPDNLSVYLTLGSVYDNLYQREATAGHTADAQSHFDNALKYYNLALDKDEKYLDAIYSVGALYYNKAAVISKAMKGLEEDYSKEGLAKYEAEQKKIFDQFDLALPYFKRAEILNPNDNNTLIALKEIYAKKNELDVSNEFKLRLEKVQNGETNEESYFKN